MRQRFLFIWIVLGLALSSILPVTAAPEGPPDLVIAHTNDIHAHYRSFEDRQGNLRGGMARLAWRIDELREEYGECFLYLDAGDIFQGTPFYHFHRGRLGMELLAAMGCDAMALGNHELDDGPRNFLDAAAPYPFPKLCANLRLPGGELFLPASARLMAGDLSVDVVGLLTADAPEIIPCVSRGELLLTPPAEALAAWLGSVEKPADLTLVLSHCGLGEDLETAAAVPGIPLIIGGHSHSFLQKPELVGGTTIVQTGCYGYNLGLLRLWRLEDGGWEIEYTLEAVTADWPEDEAVRAIVEEGAQVVDREMNVVIGKVGGDFGISGKSESPDPLGQMISESLRKTAGTDIGLQNTGGYRTYLKVGEMKRETLFTLLPFDNKIVRLSFRGAELQKLFDFLAASCGSGRFGQIAGASYRIVDGKAADLRVGGELIDPTKTYTVATLDFLVGGGDGYTVLGEAFESETLDLFARDALEAMLAGGWEPAPSDFPPNFQ